MKYWLFLQHVIGVGSCKLLPIIERFGSARRFYDAGYEEVYKSGLLSNAELTRFSKYSLSECDRIIDECIKLGYDIITPNDKRYPKCLAHIINPPAVLFVKGTFLNFDDEVTLAMVGTRKCSENGAIIAGELSRQLVTAGAVIISGGALGIDSAAHRGALSVKGKTVAVLGCGLNYPYLRENSRLRDEIAENGCLISEYPPSVAPSKFTFPIRNRLISGLSLGTIVIEAKAGSGSLITVDHALEQGRDIFVIPGEISNPLYAGSNRLIRDGARSITSAFDILEEYKNHFPHRINFNKLDSYIASHDDVKSDRKSKERAVETIDESDDTKNEISQQDLDLLSDDAKRLYLSFLEIESDNFDLAVEKSCLSTSDAIAALTELEIFGIVSAIPGGRYSVKKIKEARDV